MGPVVCWPLFNRLGSDDRPTFPSRAKPQAVDFVPTWFVFVLFGGSPVWGYFGTSAARTKDAQFCNGWRIARSSSEGTFSSKGNPDPDVRSGELVDRGRGCVWGLVNLVCLFVWVGWMVEGRATIHACACSHIADCCADLAVAQRVLKNPALAPHAKNDASAMSKG